MVVKMEKAFIFIFFLVYYRENYNKWHRKERYMGKGKRVKWIVED